MTETEDTEMTHFQTIVPTSLILFAVIPLSYTLDTACVIEKEKCASWDVITCFTSGADGEITAMGTRNSELKSCANIKLDSMDAVEAIVKNPTKPEVSKATVCDRKPGFKVACVTVTLDHRTQLVPLVFKVGPQPSKLEAAIPTKLATATKTPKLASSVCAIDKGDCKADAIVYCEETSGSKIGKPLTDEKTSLKFCKDSAGKLDSFKAVSKELWRPSDPELTCAMKCDMENRYVTCAKYMKNDEFAWVPVVFNHKPLTSFSEVVTASDNSKPLAVLPPDSKLCK